MTIIKKAPSLALRGFFFAILSIVTKKKSFFSRSRKRYGSAFFIFGYQTKKAPELSAQGLLYSVFINLHNFYTDLPQLSI